MAETDRRTEQGRIDRRMDRDRECDDNGKDERRRKKAPIFQYHMLETGIRPGAEIG